MTLFPCLIFSSKVHTERCKRGLLCFLEKSKRRFPPTLLEIYHSTVGVITAAAAAFVSDSGVTHNHGMSQHDFNCQWDCGHFSRRWVLMACYGNERKEQQPCTEQWAEPFSCPTIKGFAVKAIPNRLSLWLWMQNDDSICAQIDVYSTEAAVTTLPEILFILFAMTVCFPETSRIKTACLNASEEEVRNCSCTLVEVILGYRSKIPSEHCPKLSSSLWQLWLWLPCWWPTVSIGLSLAAGALSYSLPLSLSHSLSLYVVFSFALCLTLFFLWMAKWPVPPPPLLVCVPHLSVWFMFLPAGKDFKRFQVWSFNEV